MLVFMGIDVKVVEILLFIGGSYLCDGGSSVNV